MHSVHLFRHKDHVAETKCIITTFVASDLSQAVAYFENPEKIVCSFRIGTAKG